MGGGTTTDDTTEKFCLKWNEFETNLSLAFKDLQQTGELFDITLICDENQLQAHKVILSACSPFFREVLRRNPHKHPLLYLKDVKYEDMQALLTFMYQGEVNVTQEQLNSFLMVAEDLKVKGLTKGAKPDGSSKPKQRRLDESRTAKRSPSVDMNGGVAPNKMPKMTRMDYTPQKEISPVSSQSQPQPSNSIKMEEITLVDDEPENQIEAYTDDAYGTYEEDNYGDIVEEGGYDPLAATTDDQMNHSDSIIRIQPEDRPDLSVELNLEEYYVTKGGNHECALCGHLSQTKRLIKVHLEGKHGLSTGYTCEYCNIFHKTSEALRIHKRRKHADMAGKPGIYATSI